MYQRTDLGKGTAVARELAHFPGSAEAREVKGAAAWRTEECRSEVKLVIQEKDMDW